MATTLLKRSSAVWIPPRSVGERALVSEASLLVMAGSIDAKAGARGARTSLEALPAMKSAVLVFDARDVTLLAVKLPPLSGARLEKALPNLLEDSLLQDAHGCGFALGPVLADGRRLVAVIDRGWLEFVVGAFERRGVKIAAAWPAQLAIAFEPGQWSIACVHDALALRTGEFEGLGWTAGEDPQGRSEALAAAIGAASLATPLPERITVGGEDAGWRASVEQAATSIGVPVSFTALAPVQSCALDLLAARRGTAGGRWLASVDWRSWRLPAAVVAACLLAWLIGLNIHWGQLVRERNALRSEMELTFRKTFPNARVVVDPLLQMQRQVAEMRLNTGRSGADDFLPLLARLSLALGPRANDALAALEYRSGRLRARFKAGFLASSASRDSLRAALEQRGLRVEFDGQDPSLAVVGPRT